MPRFGGLGAGQFAHMGGNGQLSAAAFAGAPAPAGFRWEFVTITGGEKVMRTDGPVVALVWVGN